MPLGRFRVALLSLDRIIKIASPNGDSIQKAYDMIHAIVAEPEEGVIYKGTVVKIEIPKRLHDTTDAVIDTLNHRRIVRFALAILRVDKSPTVDCSAHFLGGGEERFGQVLDMDDFMQLVGSQI